MYSGNLLLWQHLRQAFWHLYNPEKQSFLLSPLWKYLTKKPHNKPQQRLLQQRRPDTHYPDLMQASGRGTLCHLYQSKKVQEGWEQWTQPRVLCDSGHKATANAQETYTVQETRTSKPVRFSASFLSWPLPATGPIKFFFSLPLPTLDFSAAIRSVSA